MEGLYPWKCHQGELVKVSEVFWRLRFQARWFQIDMQFPHMSSCCDVAGKTTRRALWTNFEENFTTPSPRYDYTFNMIFRIWNLEPFHIITHFMLVITHYFTEYTFILYCNANAKYCIFVQLRCTTSRSFLPRPSGTDKGLAEASAKKESFKMLWIFIKTLI